MSGSSGPGPGPFPGPAPFPSPVVSGGNQLPMQQPGTGMLSGGQGAGAGAGAGGFDWTKVLQAGGMLTGAGADIYGAYKQGQTNDQNYAAQLAQQQMVNGLVGQYMQPAGQQNPYASQMMQMLGGMRPPSNAEVAGGVAPANTPLATQNAGWESQPLPQNGSWTNRSVGLPPGTDMAPGGQANMMGPSQATDIGGMVAQNGGAKPIAPMGYSYQNQPNSAFNYRANQLGRAPTVNAPQQAAPNAMAAAQLGGVPQNSAALVNAAPQASTAQVNNPAQLGAAPQISAQQIQMPGAINLPQVGSPQQVQSGNVAVGTSGFNAGQDGLLQMMRRDVGAQRDGSIDPMLQAGTGQFDNSKLFASLAPQDAQLLDEQTNALRGSAGSFGQRFGSQMMKNEGMMREQFANNIAARNAGIVQQSFESSANRNLQAAGVQAGREQFFGQQPMQNAQLQLQAAQAAQQGGLGLAGMDLQAQQANQSSGLQAQQFNVGQNQQAQQFNAQNSINASLASQGIAAQIGQANASNALNASQANQSLAGQYGLTNAQMQQQAAMQNAQFQQQSSQFNAGNSLQALLANQSASQQTGMQNQQLSYQQQLQNAQLQQQAGMFNTSNSMTVGQQNQSAMLQALLANQGLAGQYGLANQSAMNQAGQFNAGMNMQNNQFGAQQGNIYNQLQMSGLMNAAGLQQQTQGNNNQLLGILAGLSVPQQQVNPMYGAIGNAAQTAAFMPSILSMLGGR
jgi:hypothetical protein